MNRSLRNRDIVRCRSSTATPTVPRQRQAEPHREQNRKRRTPSPANNRITACDSPDARPKFFVLVETGGNKRPNSDRNSHGRPAKRSIMVTLIAQKTASYIRSRSSCPPLAARQNGLGEQGITNPCAHGNRHTKNNDDCEHRAQQTGRAFR